MRFYAVATEPRPPLIARARRTRGAGAANDNMFPRMLEGLKRPTTLHV